MHDPQGRLSGGCVYRFDKFTVPAGAREEFLARVRTIHRMLETLPGYQDGVILEQGNGADRSNVVTIAVWRSRAVFDEARRVVRARYDQEGFDPQAMMRRLGIEADMAVYEPLGAA